MGNLYFIITINILLLWLVPQNWIDFCLQALNLI